MPGWLQVFAEHQPVSVVIDAARALTHRRPDPRARACRRSPGSSASSRCARPSPSTSTAASPDPSASGGLSPNRAICSNSAVTDALDDGELRAQQRRGTRRVARRGRGVEPRRVRALGAPAHTHRHRCATACTAATPSRFPRRTSCSAVRSRAVGLRHRPRVRRRRRQPTCTCVDGAAIVLRVRRRARDPVGTVVPTRRRRFAARLLERDGPPSSRSGCSWSPTS